MRTTVEAILSTHCAFASAYVEKDGRWSILHPQTDPNRKTLVILQS